MRLEIERAKLLAFFDAHRSFYSLRYIEICTQINTSALRLLLNQGAIAYGNRILHIECIEGNYRAIVKMRKATPKEQAARELAKQRSKAFDHAIARGVPKNKARMAALNGVCDLD
jgi:hypothetical protein